MQNKGWILQNVYRKDTSVPEEIRIRGFKINKIEQPEKHNSEPGKFDLKANLYRHSIISFQVKVFHAHPISKPFMELLLCHAFVIYIGLEIVVSIAVVFQFVYSFLDFNSLNSFCLFEGIIMHEYVQSKSFSCMNISVACAYSKFHF